VCDCTAFMAGEDARDCVGSARVRPFERQHTAQGAAVGAARRRPARPYFRPDEARPSITRRCSTTNSTSTGAMAIRLAAIIRG